MVVGAFGVTEVGDRLGFEVVLVFSRRLRFWIRCVQGFGNVQGFTEGLCDVLVFDVQGLGFFFRDFGVFTVLRVFGLCGLFRFFFCVFGLAEVLWRVVLWIRCVFKIFCFCSAFGAVHGVRMFRVLRWLWVLGVQGFRGCSQFDGGRSGGSWFWFCPEFQSRFGAFKVCGMFGVQRLRVFRCW